MKEVLIDDYGWLNKSKSRTQMLRRRSSK